MKAFRLLLLFLSILAVVLGFFAVVGKTHVFLAIFSLLMVLILLPVFLRGMKSK